MKQHILLGQTLTFNGDPFQDKPENVARVDTNGAVAIEGDRIIAVGNAPVITSQFPDAKIHDYQGKLIVPGFVDTHMHYPQTAIIASWGKRLIDWLNTYTFPEETKFSDITYARDIAGRTLDLANSHGTTTLTSFCTIHPESVDAFFEAAAMRNMNVVAGKTCMDRNAPENLQDTAKTAYDDSADLIAKWHQAGRATYAVTPRFSPTSTEDQLEAMGALWAENPSCLMQTHLSEQTDEVTWVKSLFPDSQDYLATYEKHGLVGKGALFGHAIYLTERERHVLREAEAGLVHCPTSNLFIGSGTFDLAALKAEGQKIGLATDTGGGSSFSMLRTMAAAYEVSQLRGYALHPAQLFWLATEAGAKLLLQDGQIGRLAPGGFADICVIDLQSTPTIAQRVDNADDVWSSIFPTIVMGDDRAITDVWIAGRCQAQSD